MALFNAEVSQKLRGVLDQMTDPVRIVLFTQEFECQFCREARQFVEELTGLSSKLSLAVYELVADQVIADRFGVDKVPAILLLDQAGQDLRLRFYGIPAGYEINSFLSAILAAAGRRETIPPDLRARIDRINQDVLLQVYVSLACPNCPEAVMAANLLALENPRIRAEMIETAMFVHLALQHNVSSVPKTIINGRTEFVGALPVPMLLEMIDFAAEEAAGGLPGAKAADPGKAGNPGL